MIFLACMYMYHMNVFMCTYIYTYCYCYKYTHIHVYLCIYRTIDTHGYGVTTDRLKWYTQTQQTFIVTSNAMQNLGPVPPSGGTKAIFLDLPQGKMAEKKLCVFLGFLGLAFSCQNIFKSDLSTNLTNCVLSKSPIVFSFGHSKTSGRWKSLHGSKSKAPSQCQSEFSSSRNPSLDTRHLWVKIVYPLVMSK